MTDDPKRSFLQSAVYNFFALYLGVTPPAPSQTRFYAALLLVLAALLLVGGYFAVRLLLGWMIG